MSAEFLYGINTAEEILTAGRRRVPAVFFNAKLDGLPRPPWDVAYTLDWNCWQGRTEAQMRIVGVRRAA